MNGDTNTLKLTRQELYDRIWSEPATKVAKGLGISTFTLGNLCIKHRIPKPSMAYWAKIKSGQKAQRASLRTVEDKSLEVVQIELTPGVVEPKTLRAKPNVEIPVPDTLDSPHALVQHTIAGLNSARPDEKGLVQSSDPQSLNVRVAQNSIMRAMVLMDTLVKALEARGFPVAVDSEGNTTAEIDGEKIQIHLRELLGQRKPTQEDLRIQQEQIKAIRKFIETHPGRPLPPHAIGSPSRVYFPSGQLILSIEDGYGEGYPQRWRDTKRRRVEDCLGSCIEGLVSG